MYNNNLIAKSVRFALMSGVGAAALATPVVLAAEESVAVERITVTGSAIKRTDLEGALPITVISRADIDRSGVTSVPDLIATLPSMQGFTTSSDSVGGGGGGIQSASLRGLGDQYTLVLLNGRRMASADTGGVIDLNQIPLSAIKRVEVLMDGASALYGSDAIAGVVNFILKDDLQETTFDFRGDKPQEQGGESYSFSLSSGFGDIASDGFNLMFAVSHDKQEALKSTDRDFAETGIFDFSHNDTDYTFVKGSTNAGPANAYLNFLQYNTDGSVKKVEIKDEEGNGTGKFKPVTTPREFNPFREENGQCGTDSAPQGSVCTYDYTSTLEINPESSRDNVFVQGIVEINDSVELYSSAAWSSFQMTTRVAPYPTGDFSLDPTTELVANQILPYLTADEAAQLAVDPNYLHSVEAAWRVLPGGNRTDEWDTETINFTTGLRGELSEINYDVAVTYAGAARDQNRITGYPIESTFLPLIKSGDINVFDEFASLTDEQNQMVKDTMYNGGWESTDTSLLSFEGTASTMVAELPAGDMYMAMGGDYREQEFTRRRSQANSDAIILFEAPTNEFDLSRETYGMFVEAIVPVWDTLEITAALRYDSIGAVTDHDRDGLVVNDDVDDTTYKISASYRPNDAWLLRASMGTGFKAATMKQIGSPREDFGVTSGNYVCPTGLRAELVPLCKSGSTQYQVWQAGNSDLQPETSEQMSVGFVYAPTNDFSFGLDYWSVDLENQVTRLTQAQIFSDAVKYDQYFTTKPNRGTGKNDLAITQAAVNVGKSENSGIDWALNMITEFSFGDLKSSFTGTYITESKSLRAGTTDQWDSSLGRFGIDDNVIFDVQAAFNNTLTMGDFAHSLNVTYRSGYEDQLKESSSKLVRLGNDISEVAPDIQLYVPSYWKVDYLTSYDINKNAQVVFGITNLFDKQPPLSLRTSGAGHQVGFDPRYTDVKGRTFYLSGSYTF
ncbi:TonB-dependent receptor [Shewanella sp. VB17]|uniref:TonB-dependent receptor n=1 Tax=Shewanella sp. VB17 TaxID=2739432 RepID=UPI0015657CCA|nr:TonB-dependent receptor [Shewanella sp. VB17]NRD74615.1 TonB-dependent receptor [Shewanella sp. VB17]